jgi:pimeloyl-ACP methyl ester carboxylesterase
VGSAKTGEIADSVGVEGAYPQPVIFGCLVGPGEERGMRNGSRPPDTIVLIHGPWLTPRSWDGWAERYARRGYHVLAPAWPGMEVEVEALNADPSPIAQLTVDRVVNHYEQIVLDLDRPPLIVGHSFGGTVTQVLLDRGLGAAGLGIASATVLALGDLGRFVGGEVVVLTSAGFHDGFANTMSRRESDAIHARYHVPAPRAMLSRDAFANVHPDAPTRRDPRREPRAPLLLIGFSQDRLVRPSAVRPSQEDDEITAMLTFPGRPHYPAAPGWEEVADHALDWLVEHAGAAGRAGPASTTPRGVGA